MLRRLNITLAILALCGAMFVGGIYLYTNVFNKDISKVVDELEG